jgi:transketolase
MTANPTSQTDLAVNAEVKQQMAHAIRALAMDAVQAANSGHPGMPMGMADVATVLFTEFLTVDVQHPEWPDRDRFVLSAGHGSMLHYALNYLLGYDDMPIAELKKFRQLGAKTAGHPEYGHAKGIETTTGPLGQGIANAVGMALAERMLAAEFGDELVNHHTYVIAGDGCLMEGISHEAASLAGHLGLSKLVLLFDDNGISIDGPTNLTVSENTCARFEAYGWATERIDGHDMQAIRAALQRAQTSAKPVFIACKTVIAKNAPSKAGTSASHGAPLGADEISGARAAMHWPHAPFEMPDDILSAWRDSGARNVAEYAHWQARLGSHSADAQAAFYQRIEGDLGGEWQQAVSDAKRAFSQEKPNEATRKSSQKMLDIISPHIPALVGGSADLSGSNNTKAQAMQFLTPSHFEGRYIHYGVREHAMASMMNGMALHGGFVPYGGTFLVFCDYCRPAIRLSALMGLRVIYVMTHDSIGLGEDGPTHQPVEHLASLRVIPNLQVFRPADATETAECWALALASQHTPSVLSLTRQNIPHLRAEYVEENLCARGAYALIDTADAEIVLIASGSEVHLAMLAGKELLGKGKRVRVVSMPSMELFRAQPKAYQDKILGAPGTRRVAVEAACEQGWEKFLGENGSFIGMHGFGASAPAPELYAHFGITKEAIIKAALQ